MPFLRDAPIQRKLRFVILVTCTAALCAGSAALFTIQYFAFQRDYRRDIASVAEIIAGLCAQTLPLGAASETGDFLKALKVKPKITGAFIRLNDGRIVSQYGQTGGIPVQDLDVEGYSERNGLLVYAHPIVDHGQRLGTVCLLADYGAETTLLQFFYASILAGVLALSLLVAIVVSSRLEKLISAPIRSLAETARRIASGSDYSLRAAKSANDEVGQFTDTFNGMLEQIQQREAALTHEIGERARAELELQRVHSQLMEASREAGMAEVATGVLHNVGNVLNSVNVSSTIIGEKLTSIRMDHLLRAAQMLGGRNGNMDEFLAEDPKGRLLPGYITEAGEHLAGEHREALAELDLLSRNIEHIKKIVSMQQSFARVSGVIETLHIEELVEEAVRMDAGAHERHRIEIVREFEPVPPVSADKHQLLQILINLLRNAKHALDRSDPAHRRITLRIHDRGAGAVRIQVSDNGIGIPAENLTRIFAHGFTTRETGSGFGLHSSALAARQLGGSLSAASGGPGRGATFTLELPLARPPSRDSLPPASSADSPDSDSAS